jgi:hypothetical protein
LGTRIAEGLFGEAVGEAQDTRARLAEARDLREGMTTGPGEGLEPITGDSLLRGIPPMMSDGPGEGLEEITEENLMPPEREVVDTGDTGDTGGGADLDFNDPNTFDANFKTVMSRLESVMGTKDKDSRQEAMANLAMIGLAIAAGQSPDALTNIAQGALSGTQAIRAERAAREEQDKAMRMTAMKAAMDMQSAQASDAARAMEGQLDRESRERVADISAAGGGGRNPRAVEDFFQNLYNTSLTAAQSPASPTDMVEGETPSQYALRIAEAGLRNQRLQFPQT